MKVLEPNEVWDYAVVHDEELELEPELIACDEEADTDVYLSTEENHPVITVALGGFPILDEEVFDRAECLETVLGIYKSYVGDEEAAELLASLPDEDVQEIDQEECEMINDREEELDQVFVDMMYMLSPNIDEMGVDKGQILEDLKDWVCERLFKKYKISVYRPMILEDEDGEKTFSQYPYEEL